MLNIFASLVDQDLLPGLLALEALLIFESLYLECPESSPKVHSCKLLE